ncbi:unnamed protein product [Sphagnum compactum]
MSASWSGESRSSFGLHESSQQELYDVPAASEDDPASAVEVDASVAGAAVLVQELNWKELLQVLVENWPWLLYAVVWKLNPHNRTIVWHQGKFNGGNLQPPDALLQQHDPAAESRRLEAIFYTVYKSCTFTISPSSGYVARALFQESPLWWTYDMPRLVTEGRKDRFLQQSGIKTMVCLPGRGSDGNIYCLEIASTHLILETSELLQTFKQLFMSGSSVFPSLSPLENFVLLPAAGGSSSSSSRGGHVEIAAAAAWFHAHNYGTAAAAPREVPAPHAFGNHMQSPSWDDHELGILDPDDDHEEIASLQQQQQQQQEVFTQLESMDSAAVGRSTAAADAISNFVQLQPTMALDSLIMQAYQNMDQLDSETTDPAAAVAALQHPPAMSSVINLAALFDTVFGTNSDPAIVSSSCYDDDDDQVQDLEPFHDLVQQQHHQNVTLRHHDGHELAQQSSAAMSTNPYEIMYPELQSPTADALTSAATSERPAAQPDSCLPDRFPLATDQLLVDPAMDLHHGATFLDLDAEPDHSAVKNPFDHHRQQQQQQNPSREQCSPFKSLEPSRRLSKRRRLDAVDNSMQRSQTASGIFGAAAAGPSSTAPPPPPRPRQSMIELWKSLSRRIQESDRIQRVEQRVQETLMRSSSSSRDAHAGDTSAVVLQQLQLQGAAGAAAVSRSTSDDLLPAPGRGLFDMTSRDVLDQLQTYNIPADWQAPVAHVDQAQIAEKHKMQERDRRSRIKTEINALDSLLPASKKKDTLSILTKATHYIRQLKDQIAAVRVEKVGSATFLQQQTHDRPAVVQAAAAGGPASSSSFSSINNLSCCSTRVAVRPAEAHVIADGASTSRDLVIDVKSRNNLQTLIHILSIVRDSALEVGSLSSDDAGVIQGRMAFSLTVPVPSSLQQTPLCCDKVKEAVEREILQNIAAHDMTSRRLSAPSAASPDSETPTETLTPSPGVKKHKGMSEP